MEKKKFKLVWYQNLSLPSLLVSCLDSSFQLDSAALL